ncbi:hypothetical protein M408DRAFT_18285 [Serendipita vermifera MAFF 305830]|uniref:SSD domain-containing protein n=1 Tax=Serendipita vermifera MAFF 305830 TaxID=933852 RepID=A0A0C2WX81_SERVB|nr:hypothetical protein M408DRAFT_18285 [Serendipita vermifera MAFF 305830]
MAEPQGSCAFRGGCGKKSVFGAELPCPDTGAPTEPDEAFRELLVDVCGSEFASGPTCCTSAQVTALRDNLQQVEPIISSCPACRNNFRTFFCDFTCSPLQGSFVNVTATQTTTEGKEAIKSVDFFAGEKFATGFYDSCKEVKYGPSAGYAMGFIGGGAKDYHGLLKFLGDEKPLGSPFQINFPSEAPSGYIPLDPRPRNCADADLGSKCVCVDCPSVCPALPPQLTPEERAASCQIGSITCLSFVLLVAYGLAAVAFLLGFTIQRFMRKRKDRSYERVALSGDTSSSLNNPAVVSQPLHGPPSGSNAGNRSSLVGASSLALYFEGEEPSQEVSRHHLGRGASLLDPNETVQPRQYHLNTILRRAFYRLGLTSASHPWLMFVFVFAIFAGLNSGWKYFQVETDPVRLWVAPSSQSRLQKDFFDEHFGPFYRPQQIFMTAPASDTYLTDPITNSSSVAEELQPILSWKRLQWWDSVEKKIAELQTEDGTTLDDVCFKPAGPNGDCVIQSVMGWYGDLSDWDEDSWEDRLLSCAESPGDQECLPPFGQPLSPALVLGGVTDENYLDAPSLVVTYVLNNSLDEKVVAKVESWERLLRAFLHDLSESSPTDSGTQVFFSTGVSLEEELNKSTNTDARIVVLSYLVMFLYVSLTLGGNSSAEDGSIIGAFYTWIVGIPSLFRKKHVTSEPLASDSRRRSTWYPRLPRNIFIGSKFFLGLFGIMLVILSVSASVGLFSFLHVRVTLIIAEVIPFLVLAVGVDNVFILVHELDRQNSLHGPNAANPGLAHNGNGPNGQLSPTSYRSPFMSTHEGSDADADSVPLHLSPEERVARAVAKMGPSILLSTTTETVAFALGALVPMPAVRNFALYAAGSVFLNACLQLTVFVSAMTIDLRRVEANRVDCFPCIRIAPRIELSEGFSSGSGKITHFFRRKYGPFILNRSVKGFILLFFAGIFVASVISMQHISLGLDQRLALPSESYLVPYFDAMDRFLDVGPPVYFVSTNVDVTKREGQRTLCARFTTCEDTSIANILEGERKRPESSFISEPAASWIDDFLRWTDPVLESCCRVRKRDPSIFCRPTDSERLCRPCFEDSTPPWNITLEGLPEGPEFMRYLGQWLITPTDEECPLGGQAAYGTAVSRSRDHTRVDASHFRTFHSPLKTQADFINAFEAAHRIADDLSASTGTTVFPYSLFYVFFDQYAHIIHMTQQVLGLGLLSVLLVTSVLLGSWRTGIIVTGVVALTVVNCMGVMGLWGISLNAISLVNLVISLGIAVEFCSHIGRAFMGMVSYQAHEVLSYSLTPEGEQIAEQGSHEARVWAALSEKGGTPVSIKDLKSKVGDESAKVGQGRAFKSGWIVKDGENLYKAVRNIASMYPRGHED